MLAQKGYYLGPGAKVLDFGCGEGRTVYEYREAGFDAYGFEIREAPKLRQPEDQKFFLYSLTGIPVHAPDFAVNPTSYEIPCEDNFFDFIFSVTTLEHIQNLDLALSECARVLKPGGVALHIFPSRYMRLEPYLYIPYGGFIQNYYWYLFWAILGVRNEWQQKMRPRECARSSLQYARNCLSYPPLNTILKSAQEYFHHVEVDPRLWEFRIPGRTTFWTGFLSTPWLHRLATWWYCRFCMLALFLIK